jgi:hypothetical protein
MTSWLLGSLLLVAGLVLMDRLLLRAEARGWIFYRRRKPSPGTSAAAAFTLQAMWQPQARHVVESVIDRADWQREDQDEGEGPRGARP